MYTANHSVLPGVTLEARAPDEHGHPTGHLVKLGGNAIHAWEYENAPFGRITGIASGDVTVAIEPQPGTRHIDGDRTSNFMTWVSPWISVPENVRFHCACMECVIGLQ